MDISISLKEAIRERPDVPARYSPQGSAVRRYEGWGNSQSTIVQRALKSVRENLPGDKVISNGVIVKAMWTASEFRTFDRLTEMACAGDMEQRRRSKVWLDAFIKKHGREKCDMMLAEVRRRAEVAWFHDNKDRLKGA